MYLFRIAAVVVLCAPLGASQVWAQSAGQAESATPGAALTPATKVTSPVLQPDLRLDSALPPQTLGLGANFALLLGQDIRPVTPAGMIGRSVPGDPALVYFALRHRSGDDLTSSDRAILDAREPDLVRAAAYHGYYLKQPGWMYQQGICPAAQANAAQVVGVPAGADGQGFLVLHFVRRTDGRVSAFSAIVPRTAGLPVRVVTVAHRGVEQRADFLSAKTSGVAVNEALPPSVLYSNLQPQMDWIAASACIAEMGGGYPHIPSAPYLTDAIMTAPTPEIRLMLDGQRRVIFTDRTDDSHYVVWQEHVSNHGRMLDGQHQIVRIVPRPILNPPGPPSHAEATPALPPVHIKPPPPSPLSGQAQ